MTISSPASSHASPLAAKESIELRDWFAGHVMAAMLVAPKQPGVTRLEMDDMARMSYQYADAMLKVR
jgi:hypothetical protein